MHRRSFFKALPLFGMGLAILPKKEEKEEIKTPNTGIRKASNVVILDAEGNHHHVLVTSITDTTYETLSRQSFPILQIGK